MKNEWRRRKASCRGIAPLSLSFERDENKQYAGGMEEMDTADRIFAHKAVNYQKLENYGFCRDEKGFYIYHTVLSGSGFVMNVTVSEEGAVAAEIVDPAFDEPYTLHLTGGAGGSFVGGVKEEYERTLRDISEKCFQPDIFRAEQTREAIAVCTQRVR